MYPIPTQHHAGMASPPLSRRTTLLLLLDAAVALLCVYGIVQSAAKAWPGVEMEQVSGMDPRPRVLATRGDFLAGDIVIGINDARIARFEDMERACDALPVGALARICVLRAGIPRGADLRLPAFYGTAYIVVQTITTVLFLLLAMLVLLRRPDDAAARAFHLLALVLAGLVACTHGRYTTPPAAVGYLVRALFPVFVALCGAALLRFAALFPLVRPRALAFARVAAWIAAVIAAAGCATSLAVTAGGLEAVAAWYYGCVSVSKAFIAAAMLAALALFVTAGRAGRLERAERHKLAWVLLGLFVATVVFVFLWLLPRALLIRNVLSGPLPAGLPVPVIPEEVLLLSIAFAGVCMTAGIVRHRLFDIDLILRRGSLYVVVFGLLLGVYLLLLFALLRLAGPLPAGGTTIAIAATVALDLALFLPVRGAAQRMLDRWFFRVHYDYRAAQRRFSGELAREATVDGIAGLLLAHTDALIPVERIGCFAVQAGGRMRLVAGRGFDLLAERGLPLSLPDLRTDLRLPVALPSAIDPDFPHETADSRMFGRWQIALVLALRAENQGVLGFLVLGAKRSGTRFTAEDVDLLRTATEQAAIQIERIALAERLAVEHAESARLAELNRLKSLFVSGVSHDLRTPLTSIRLFAELLRTRSCADDVEAARHLEIIEGECGRLSRLIENVLDFAKIEQGVKEYHPATIDLNDIAARALDLHDYQLRISGAAARLQRCNVPCLVHADADAVLGALVNLLANAVKYGIREGGRTGRGDQAATATTLAVVHEAGPASGTRIDITVARAGTCATLSVRDYGPGIPATDLAHVFEAFYRGEGAEARGRGGAGLGLALVRHIMDAHGGSATAENAVDGGCKITLTFPTAEDT
jgi:signal transduction histidine kinase